MLDQNLLKKYTQHDEKKLIDTDMCMAWLYQHEPIDRLVENARGKIKVSNFRLFSAKNICMMYLIVSRTMLLSFKRIRTREYSTSCWIREFANVLTEPVLSFRFSLHNRFQNKYMWMQINLMIMMTMQMNKYGITNAPTAFVCNVNSNKTRGKSLTFVLVL